MLRKIWFQLQTFDSDSTILWMISRINNSCLDFRQVQNACISQVVSCHFNYSLVHTSKVLSISGWSSNIVTGLRADVSPSMPQQQLSVGLICLKCDVTPHPALQSLRLHHPVPTPPTPTIRTWTPENPILLGLQYSILQGWKRQF